MKRKAQASLGHGGRHQRVAGEEARGSSDPGPALPNQGSVCGSALGSYLLKKWAWGEISAVRLQEIAHESYKHQAALLKSLGISTDMIPGELARLAKLGSWGENPGDVHQQLLTHLGGSIHTSIHAALGPGERS